MAELGIVGLLLLLAAVVAVFIAICSRLRLGNRSVTAGLVAISACWLVHTGVDWDWQMPVITWWLFAAGGLALAREHAPPSAAHIGQFGRLGAAVAIGVLAVVPVQIALSQTNLNRAVADLKHGNCNASANAALASIADLSARPEPYELLGYCDARSRLRVLSQEMIQEAINRDPQNWEFQYDMALVRGVAGLDPRPAAARALRLNPLSPLTTTLAHSMRGSSPHVWRAAARRAELLLGQIER
jgi:hypothetical protein